MKTAFQNSVVWYYQEVARARDLKRCSTISMPPGMATEGGQPGRPVLAGWHTEDPADEQVEFLEAALSRRFTFSKRSPETVRQIMLIEEDELHRLRGKTGSGIAGDQYIGWFVATRKEMGMYFFALTLRAQARGQWQQSPEIALQILQDPFYFSLNESMTTQTPDPREELSIRTVKTALAGEFFRNREYPSSIFRPHTTGENIL